MDKMILAVDSGGRSLRSFLFNRKGDILFRASVPTPSVSVSPGAQEHNPEMMWDAFVRAVGDVMSQAGCTASDIAAMGISAQRASFMLWDKKTGKPLTPLIGWADVRAADQVDAMNRSPKWKAIQAAAAVGAFFTHDTLLTAASMLKFTTDHASTRLLWLLNERPDLRRLCENGEAAFGTTDSWFLYKMTGQHLTDASQAAATSMYNPFKIKWNPIICKTFGIPMSIFPTVLDSNGDFGESAPSLFGGAIPIRGCLGDQMAALFGHCCFDAGEVKISQGSGAFVDLNVGPKPRLSKRGLFPLIAWVKDGKPVYMLEGYVATAGTLIDWLGQGIGLSSDGKELDTLASQCTDTEGITVVPTASGIRFPYFNPRTRAAIFGLSLATHRCHVARAVLEGLALRLNDILTGMEKDTHTKIRAVNVDGGVSNSDILIQSLADFSGMTVARSAEPDMSATGAAYMAGIASGFWKDESELRTLNGNCTVFNPSINEEKRRTILKRWNRVIRQLLKLDKKPMMGFKEYRD